MRFSRNRGRPFDRLTATTPLPVAITPAAAYKYAHCSGVWAEVAKTSAAINRKPVDQVSIRAYRGACSNAINASAQMAVICVPKSSATATAVNIGADAEAG